MRCKSSDSLHLDDIIKGLVMADSETGSLAGG